MTKHYISVKLILPVLNRMKSVCLFENYYSKKNEHSADFSQKKFSSFLNYIRAHEN
jgi:hypothetical protein